LLVSQIVGGGTNPRDDSAKASFDRVARFYDPFYFIAERFTSRHRRELLRRAKGRILEIGVGTGSSFKDYPARKQILGVDISQEMLRGAEQKRNNYDGQIELRKEDVQNLSFKDEAFDTVLSSWAFCSVTDPARGLSEVRRVLKKGGCLLMLEHVRSKNKMLGRLMDKLNPLVSRLGVGNMNRDTVQYLRQAGFKIEQEINISYDVVKAIVASK
jgi:ubiquinone/menaquinone biosynthesis C-methylase UbiE